MKAWKCELCGYIHNGDEPPENCPVCGASKDQFSELVIAAPAKKQASAWQCSICEYIHNGSEHPGTCPVCGAFGNIFSAYTEEVVDAVQCDIRKLVILGAGIAGLTAAEHARMYSPEVEITLISREPVLPYYRLNLTRFLAGEVTEEELYIQHQEWFNERNIAYVTGEANLLDREAKQVVLRDGSRHGYDRLILTSGSHPFIPPIPGITRAGVTVLRTLKDAKAIQQQLVKGMKVACIGGGLLGLEIAGALSRHGVNVTVLEGYGWLLPRQLPEPAGKLLVQHMEQQGINIRCGVQVKELVGDESVHAIRFAEGDDLPVDLVVIAAGVRPNSHLARQSGLKVETGVVVDDMMQTSDPDILAAGDITEHLGVLYGIWPASFAQGVVAGSNAVGGQLEFAKMPPSNRIKVLDIELFSIGQIHPEDASTRQVELSADGTYKCLFCHDGKVVGAVLYGDTDAAGPVKEAVESRAQIQELKELRQHFPEL